MHAKKIAPLKATIVSRVMSNDIFYHEKENFTLEERLFVRRGKGEGETRFHGHVVGNLIHVIQALSSF